MSRFSKPRPFFAPAAPCRVHGLEIEGRDCGEAAAQWITSFLKTQPYRLVHFEPHLRPRNSHQILDVFRPTDQVRGASLGFGLWCVLWKTGFLRGAELIRWGSLSAELRSVIFARKLGLSSGWGL